MGTTRKHARLLIQRPDGFYLVQGVDCADQWTVDPHRATSMTHYSSEDDTNEYKGEGCIVVEFEVALTLTPTGRTCADLFRDEREQAARYDAAEAERQRLAAEAAALREQENERLFAATLGIEYPALPTPGARQ